MSTIDIDIFDFTKKNLDPKDASTIINNVSNLQIINTQLKNNEKNTYFFDVSHNIIEVLQSDNIYFIGKHDHNILGGATLRKIVESKYIMLYSEFFVFPEFRGQYYGLQIFEKVINYLQSHKVGELKIIGVSEQVLNFLDSSKTYNLVQKQKYGESDTGSDLLNLLHDTENQEKINTEYPEYTKYTKKIDPENQEILIYF